jgi:ribosomal protein S18 acetylase RimI-like enzyme
MIRKATEKDVISIARLYDDVIEYQSANGSYMSWIKGVYPTKATADTALALETLYVYDLKGSIFGSVILDCIQPEDYKNISWITKLSERPALVIHTLCVDPAHMGMGIASEMLSFAKKLAKELDCSSIRLATNSKNTGAIHLYEKNDFSIVGYNTALLDGKINCPRQCFMEHVIY